MSLAYQDFGHGPVTLVAVPPLAKNIEIAWECAQYRHYFERIASFSRYVHFDKRGTGASDRTMPIPSLDARVDDLRAVMDAAGVDRAFLWGASEGGPTALLFAVTYPDRVEGLILDSTAAVLIPQSESLVTREQWLARREIWLDRWGTDQSVTLAAMAPSVTSDPWYRAWQPRYERQSASPAALRDLVYMIEEIDVTSVLPDINVPTLARHRLDDAIVPIQQARETVAAIPGARLVEFAGADHFSHTGDDVDAWIDLLQEFTTGTRRRKHKVQVAHRSGRGGTVTSIQTLGGFGVVVGDREVPLSVWGSRRARQLCKRLATARGHPVPRAQLIDLLWADDLGAQRLSARLSVQLSTVRRILGGGVIADRASVRLDLSEVRLDIDELLTAAETDDFHRIFELYRGEFLPEDIYEDWTMAAREQARLIYVRAMRKLIIVATTTGDNEQAAAFAHRILESDPFDEEAHCQLVIALATGGHLAAARIAHVSYVGRMDELGVPSRSIAELVPILG